MRTAFMEGGSARLEIGFFLHIEISRGRDRILSTRRIPGGDLVENLYVMFFHKMKLASFCGFSDFDRGTMRETMAIFKRRNSVWRVQKILNGEIFMNFIGGRCERKWRFSKMETAFARVQNFVRGDVDENRHFY